MAFKNVLSNISKSISNKLGVAGFKLKEKSPEILLVCGIVTMGGAVVTAAIAARKHDEILDQHLTELENAKATVVTVETSSDVQNDGEIDGEAKTEEVRVRDEKEIKKSVRQVYIRTGIRFVKLYSPTVALMSVSTACFIGMKNIQAGRIAGLSGAYTGLKTAFDEYQQRNIELNGEENHKMCKYGYKEIEVEEEDPDNGEKYTVKKKVPLDAHEVAEKVNGAGAVGDDLSCADDVNKTAFNQNGWVIIFDKHSVLFTGENNDDRNNLMRAQDWVINWVNSRGWVVLNDVYDLLKLPRTIEGTRLGWVRGMGPTPSFGMNSTINKSFINGHQYDEVILELNVHGDVATLIKMKELKEKQKLACAGDSRKAG